MNQIPMTRNGAELLKNELKILKSEERPNIIEAIADSWIEIQDINSEIIVSKIIKKDTKVNIPYKKDLILVTGNAGGIIIHIGNDIINNIL